MVPFLERLARRTFRWALLGLAGAALTWWLLADRVVTGGSRAAALAVWAVVLLAPPTMLAADGIALRALARLPDRLRTLPGEAAGRAGELRRLAEEVGRVRDRGRARSMLSLLRLWRRAAGSRDLLDVAAPVAFLFSPWTIVASLVAAAAAVIEVALGAAVLLWLLLG